MFASMFSRRKSLSFSCAEKMVTGSSYVVAYMMKMKFRM